MLLVFLVFLVLFFLVFVVLGFWALVVFGFGKGKAKGLLCCLRLLVTATSLGVSVDSDVVEEAYLNCAKRTGRVRPPNRFSIYTYNIYICAHV